MGYTTDFTGQFNISPVLKDDHRMYLKEFCETRRMKRNSAIADRSSDMLREIVDLPIGDEGGYFVGGGSGFNQKLDNSVIDHNIPPVGQPGLWCKWTPNMDGYAIEWDGGEKFYNYKEWLEYIIEHFLAPWGYILNGKVEWSGEEQGDVDVIEVEYNKVSACNHVEGMKTNSNLLDKVIETLEGIKSEESNWQKDHFEDIKIPHCEWSTSRAREFLAIEILDEIIAK